MKFYSQIEGNESVWDRKNEKPLAEFKNGEFETDDKRTIEILIRLGYKVGKKETQDKGPSSPSYEELKKMAKEKGIRSVGVKKEDLEEALKEL